MSVTIEKKKLKGGRVALYLNYSFGQKRWRESLRLVLEEPDTPEARRLNREKIRMAGTIRSKRELELAGSHYGIAVPDVYKAVDWLEFFACFIHDYRGRDVNTVKAVYGHLRRYVDGDHLPTSRLTKLFCRDFYDYLRLHLHGHTPAGYFKKFKQVLEAGVDRHWLPANPAAGVRCVQHNEFSKDILSSEEMNRLAGTPCKHDELKRAFLFACHTGLRWCDVVQLTGASVDYEHRMLHFTQQKVYASSSKAILHLALSDTALRLLQYRTCRMDECVFKLPSYSYANRVLRHWVKAAGITKHITFHCARHSFITNLLIYGANIKTAAELAGHSTIRHTEKYVHVVDELKRRAVDNLPSIDLPG